ncbi:hypothetical protein TNCT_236201, partial [Trichonephila clavata]
NSKGLVQRERILALLIC